MKRSVLHRYLCLILTCFMLLSVISPLLVERPVEAQQLHKNIQTSNNLAGGGGQALH